ncbi:MAG: C40 family peptidase [Lachnospiraceae bacterium]|nr:C40 family peptidase [Lachnospiraceae bacterium]
MNEEYTKDPAKSSMRRVEPDKTTKQKSPGDKLKNETSAGESYRRKFRHGKADNAESLQERKHRKKIKRQGRKKIYADAVVASEIRRHIAENNDDGNAGGDAIEAGIGAIYGAEVRIKSEIYAAKAKSHGKASEGYGKKLHNRQHSEAVKQPGFAESAKDGTNTASGTLQKSQIKKEIQRNAIRAREKEAANGAGSLTKKFVDRAEDLIGRMAEAVAEYLKEHPWTIVIAGAVLLIILVIAGSFSSCSAMGGGVGNVTLATSFTAQDEEILAAEDDYIDLEAELRRKINSIETDYPGYDEYRYNLAEIGHNPYELAALLTVLYEDYTEAEVQAMLDTIFEKEYKLTIQRVVETRTRTETRTDTRIVTDSDTGEKYEEEYEYEVEVEYEYYILNVTLTNGSIQAAVDALGLTADQLERYQVLLETKGNKPYLFGEYVNGGGIVPDSYDDYDIPAEYLTDAEFANMIREAEKYLGYPYVWGGSNPDTSFDCSGFVSYVINHCGNGWNVGRQTADGLLGKCRRVSRSNAHPGDLIFFKGTYAKAGNGASHVGIYVGDGMMIHCGDPIHYSSIDTSYWQNHFYTFGRLNQ